MDGRDQPPRPWRLPEQLLCWHQAAVNAFDNLLRALQRFG